MTDKEIKITDLMVGDWVIFHESSKISRKCIVRNIDKDSNLIVEWIDDDDIYSELTHDISSVPLTPEILEKNGFKKDKYGQMILDEELGSSEIYIVLQEGDECYWWTVNNELIAKTRYVHELQHIFKLCKIEKEIKL